MALCAHVAQQSYETWPDVHPRVRHCFLSRVLQTGGDRCDDNDKKEVKNEPEEKINEKPPVSDPSPLPEADPPPKETVSRRVTILAPDDGEPLKPEVLTHEHDDPADTAILASISTTWTSEPYREDHFPEDVDVSKVKKRYRAIPDKYYTTTGLHPVTPDNFHGWFRKAKGRGLRWHAWELCSGSGRLSLVLLMAGLVTGFPVDYRYGWNLCNPSHQQMLNMAYREFRPGYVHAAMDCAPWSQAGNTKDPGERYAERMRDRPGLEFTQHIFEEQGRHGRGYGLEQPWGSAMWQPLPENPIHLEDIPGNRKKQRVDQCMHGAMDENKIPIQKATGLGSNVKWTKTAMRCSGHRGQGHEQCIHGPCVSG